MENLYREVMDLNMMEDNDEKEAVAKAFFDKLKKLDLADQGQLRLPLVYFIQDGNYRHKTETVVTG